MQMAKIRIMQALFVVVALAGGARADDDKAITIDKQPATVATRTFDPRRPPAEMPKLKRGEAAVTESGFGCGVQLEVQKLTANGETREVKIVGVRADLKLEVTIWLPKDVTKKIRVHEEGHRMISEYYYQDADKIAREVAKKYIGKQIDFKGADVQAAIKKEATRFCEEYLAAVEAPSQKAQEKYDEITDHGRNRVPEQRAIEESIKWAMKQGDQKSGSD